MKEPFPAPFMRYYGAIMAVEMPRKVVKDTARGRHNRGDKGGNPCGEGDVLARRCAHVWHTPSECSERVGEFRASDVR